MMEVKNCKKVWILIIIGAVIENFILGLRMLNPILKREALLYIENYSGLYFLLMGMTTLGMGLFGYSVFIIIEHIYKKRSSPKACPTERN